METESNFETYLFLSAHKIAISVYDNNKFKNLYFNEINNKNYESEISFILIDEFLKKNIFEIEKNLKTFIEKINLIVESQEFLTIQISIKKNSNSNIITENELNHLLNEAKDECKNTINDRKITHMLIDNYLLDRKQNIDFPKDSKCDFFSIDISFICLSYKYLKNLEKILKKYQISTNHILNSNYVKSFLTDKTENIFEMSIKIINGYNQNEVLIVPKERINQGFFERFFNFFN